MLSLPLSLSRALPSAPRPPPLPHRRLQCCIPRLAIVQRPQAAARLLGLAAAAAAATAAGQPAELSLSRRRRLLHATAGGGALLMQPPPVEFTRSGVVGAQAARGAREERGSRGAAEGRPTPGGGERQWTRSGAEPQCPSPRRSWLSGHQCAAGFERGLCRAARREGLGRSPCAGGCPAAFPRGQQPTTSVSSRSAAPVRWSGDAQRVEERGKALQMFEKREKEIESKIRAGSGGNLVAGGSMAPRRRLAAARSGGVRNNPCAQAAGTGDT